MRVGLRHKQQHFTLDVRAEGACYRVAVDGVEHTVNAQPLDEATLRLTIDGRTYRVTLAHGERERFVAVDGEVYAFVPESGGAAAHSVAMVASPEITAPMPGKVLQVFVQPGDQVAAGDSLLILEAMKMENRLVAEAEATVVEVRVAAGDMVDGGQVLVVLEYRAAAES